jgi:hypothetical protein
MRAMIRIKQAVIVLMLKIGFLKGRLDNLRSPYLTVPNGFRFYLSDRILPMKPRTLE